MKQVVDTKLQATTFTNLPQIEVSTGVFKEVNYTFLELYVQNGATLYNTADSTTQKNLLSVEIGEEGSLTQFSIPFPGSGSKKYDPAVLTPLTTAANISDNDAKNLYTVFGDEPSFLEIPADATKSIWSTNSTDVKGIPAANAGEQSFLTTPWSDGTTKKYVLVVPTKDMKVPKDAVGGKQTISTIGKIKVETRREKNDKKSDLSTLIGADKFMKPIYKPIVDADPTDPIIAIGGIKVTTIVTICEDGTGVKKVLMQEFRTNVGGGCGNISNTGGVISNQAGLTPTFDV